MCTYDKCDCLKSKLILIQINYFLYDRFKLLQTPNNCENLKSNSISDFKTRNVKDQNIFGYQRRKIASQQIKTRPGTVSK